MSGSQLAFMHLNIALVAEVSSICSTVDGCNIHFAVIALGLFSGLLLLISVDADGDDVFGQDL